MHKVLGRFSQTHRSDSCAVVRTHIRAPGLAATAKDNRIVLNSSSIDLVREETRRLLTVVACFTADVGRSAGSTGSHVCATQSLDPGCEEDRIRVAEE